MINKYPFALLAAVAADLSVDALHAYKGHVEEFCIQLLDSRTRNLPPGSNTESGEQQWQPLVKLTKSLNYINAGMHEFWQLSHYIMRNAWRLKKTNAELKREPKHVVSRKRSWFDGKPMDKHTYRAKKVQASKGPTVAPKKFESDRTNSRGLPLTKVLKDMLPLGFDSRLRS